MPNSGKVRAMSRREDRKQLRIDWDAEVSNDAVEVELTEPPQSKDLPRATGALSPVQALPWDFQSTFPSAMQDAVDAGVLLEEDTAPENLAALHHEHFQTMLAGLSDLDRVHDVRRRGIDPVTAKPPRSKKRKQELPEYLDREIARLERWWQTLLDSYEAGFGPVAADAFAKYIRARHAGIEILVQPTPAEVFTPPPSLPKPIPLRSSVNAGVFGQTEEGPVDPSEEESLDILLNHAEILTDLVDVFRTASQSPSSDQSASERIRQAVDKYAEDFGQESADRLLAYCHRQSLLNRADTLQLRR